MGASQSQTNLTVQAAGSTAPSVNATITPVIPTLGANQTLRNITATGSGSVVTIGTVTAGKTAYLFCVCADGTATGQTSVYASDGTTQLFTVQSGANAASACVQAGGMPLAVYQAGQPIKAAVPASTRANFFIVEV